MIEYGHAVGEGTGPGAGAGGGSGLGGGPTDIGASAVDFVSNAVDRIAALPPEMLLLLGAVVLVGLIVLRRAF
jgi:hypothetical protein